METNKQMTVCVTGVTGYIGRHLVQELLEQGYRVRGTVRTINFTDKEIEEDFSKLQKQYPGRFQLFEADLLQLERLEEAIKGCNGVFHVASPVAQSPKDPVKELIEPAVQGTLNVLKATLREVYRQRKNGSLLEKDEFRVIITSSDAAIAQSSVEFNEKHRDYIYSERDWNETATIDKSPYPFSKVLAEKAANAFADSEEAKDVNLKIICINPSLVIGPLLTSKLPPSCSVIADLLSSSFPMIPNIHWNIVDVRDVVSAHIKALEMPNATGRYLLTNNPGFWMSEMAEHLSSNFPNLPIVTKKMPNLMMYFFALFDHRINFRWVRQHLGRELKFSNNKSVIELGLHYRSPHQTLIDCSQSLISHGIIKDKIEKNKVQKKRILRTATKSLVIFGLVCAVVVWKRNFLQNTITKLLKDH